MNPDNLPKALTDDVSLQTAVLEADWRAERMKPSRQQKLTPSQRRSRAIILWGLRQARSEGKLEGSPCVLPPIGRGTHLCSTKA